MISPTIDSVRQALSILERRLSRLLTVAIPVEAEEREFASLEKELEQYHGQVAAIAEREEGDPQSLTTLEDTIRQCVWLYRKVRLERMRRGRRRLETRFQAQVSKDALRIYEEIQKTQEQQRRFTRRDDEIRSLLARQHEASEWGIRQNSHAGRARIGRVPPRAGERTRLREIVHELAALIWQFERRSCQPIDATVLRYVQDAVAVELQHWRRLRDLDGRLADVGGLEGDRIRCKGLTAQVAPPTKSSDDL